MTTLGDEGGNNQRRDIEELASFSACGQGEGLRLYSESNGKSVTGEFLAENWDDLTYENNTSMIY